MVGILLYFVGLYFSRNTIIYDDEDDKTEEQNKMLKTTDENTDDEKKDNGIKLLSVKYKPENELDQEETTLHGENGII